MIDGMCLRVAHPAKPLTGGQGQAGWVSSCPHSRRAPGKPSPDP